MRAAMGPQIKRHFILKANGFVIFLLFHRFRWWAHKGSNLRPADYEKTGLCGAKNAARDNCRRQWSEGRTSLAFATALKITGTCGVENIKVRKILKISNLARATPACRHGPRL